MNKKKCPRCNDEKGTSEFHKSRNRKDGLTCWCKSCTKKYSDEYNKSHVEENREYSRNYYKENKEKENKRTKINREKLRLEVLLHYSNGELCCDCCGEKEFEFLSIDHIYGGGREHRKESGNLYLWLKRNNFPDGFRVLCYNCNFSMGHYGRCPHKDGVS
jgi:hypothetical protein